MKSVIRGIAPHVTVIDVTHDIPPHDVRAGGLALVRAVQYLAPGVVLAVVDPGVGTDRRAVAVEVGDGEAVFVGPDNGLLAPAVAMTGGRGPGRGAHQRRVPPGRPRPHLRRPRRVRPGRGPPSAGVDLAELGELIDPVTMTPGLLPITREEGDGLVAEVLWVDRFGNAQLNVDPDEIEAFGERVALRWGEQRRTARRARTYGDLKPGEIGLVVDSYGLVSIASIDDRRPTSSACVQAMR